MALQIVPAFNSKQNSVQPVALSSSGLAVRVATGGTETLGTLTASGAQSSLTWTVSGNPSWVTISPDASTAVLTVSFSAAQAQSTPYTMLISCTDGLATVYFPILLEVRDPFWIGQASGSTVLPIASYDAAVPDIVIGGYGLNGTVEAGISFIPPLVLPAGLQFVTSDESQLILRVADSSSSNLSGGLALYTESPATTEITLQAYKPGSLYDSPDLPFTQTFTIESLTAKAGIVDLGVAASWNPTLNAFDLNATVDFLKGRSRAVIYEWDVTGTASGTTVSGGTASDLRLVWAPTAPGQVVFTFKVKDALTGVPMGQQILAPLLAGNTPGIPSAIGSTWTSTSAVKIEVSAPVSRGFVGDQPSIVVSTPVAELATGENVSLTVSVSTASAVESPATLPVASFTLNAANSSATIPLVLPPSGINEKWIVSIAAANSLTNPTRTGFATAVFESNGDPVLTVGTLSGTNLSSVTGQSIAGVLLTATSRGLPVPGIRFALQGAPDGVFISGPNLTGNALKPGTYNFKVIGEAEGFARSYSAMLTLQVSQAASPLVITTPTSSASSLPDGSQYTVKWGTTGTATVLNFIQNYAVRSVLGLSEVGTSQVGNSVLAVYGTSYYGSSYAVPVYVLSSSILALGDLLNAPAIGIIDESNELTLNWQPPTVVGGYQAYKGFNIWLSSPSGTPLLQTVSGSVPTGLEAPGSTPSSRLFEVQLKPGDWVLNMQALSANPTVALNAPSWDNPHQFPTALTSELVAFDNKTIAIGQSLTVTLDPSYTGADSWSVTYGDGSSSGWLPLSIRTTAKAFSSFGNMSVVIQTQNDFSMSNPAVKLRRQVTKSVFVMNQVFTPATSDSGLTGNLGLGGSSGFEVIDDQPDSSGSPSNYQISDASGAAVPQSPYQVVVRALVRDMLSQELKLMVATARSADASSLLGTMAIDVFPLAGRPRSPELIDPALYLSAEQVPAGNPVRIATAALPNAIVGKPFTDFPMQAAVNSGVLPLSWYVDQLPAGLKLSINGTLTGTATTLGSTTSNFVVMDASVPPFIAETTLSLLVESDLSVATTTIPQAVVGTPYQVPILVTGGLPPYTWSVVSGVPPTGLSLDATGGLLEGTPVTYNSTADFSTTYTFTVSVEDAIGAKASSVLTTTLAPAALSFGPLDQPTIFANSNWKLRVPVYGGKAPYLLSSFSDDGTVSNGLSLLSPGQVSAIAGILPPALTATTADQQFFPVSYPQNISFALEASGGTAPYIFSIVTSTASTLPGAICFGNLLVGSPAATGNYAVVVQVSDALGNVATQTVQVLVQQKNTGTYTISPVQVATNGSTNPANWTVTPVPALPNAIVGQPYNGGANVYYGMALYENNILHLSQRAGAAAPIQFALRSGALPTGIVINSGNSFGATGDFSGIVLFNVAGGSNPTASSVNSFEAEFSNIQTVTATQAISVARESISVVTDPGAAPYPAVVLSEVDPFSYDISQAASSTFGWYLPLTAEGGTGPYTYGILGGTLPGATISTYTGGPALSSLTTAPGVYTAVLTAQDLGTGSTAAPLPVQVTITDNPSEQPHIVNTNLPTYLYAGRALPANTYFIECDLLSAFTISGLPSGISINQTVGTRGYLTGTPTITGSFNYTVTAKAIAGGKTVTTGGTLTIRPQTITFLNPPSSAIVGTSYRVAQNSSIIALQYTGYQPTDTDLPLPSSKNGSIGAPGLYMAGVPTTVITNLTPDGFQMNFDYACSILGADVISLGMGFAALQLPITYPMLVATGTTIVSTVSEYTQTATFNAPVSVSGGNAPYTVTFSGFADSRFTSAGTQVSIAPLQFAAGSTVTSTVAMLVTDASGQAATAIGSIQVTIRQETYEQINFSSAVWTENISSGNSFTASIAPNRNQSSPGLGHAPYQYYVDSVELPDGLNGLVQVSPSKRLLAIQFNNNATSVTLADLDAALNASGSFVVPAVAATNAPSPGNYAISLVLRVVDSKGLSAAQTVTLTLVLN